MAKVSSFQHYTNIFYRYAGRRLWVLLGVVFLGGALEGAGVSLLLPLLDLDALSSSASIYHVMVRGLLSFLGLPFALPSILGMIFIVFLLKSVFLFLQRAITVHITTFMIKKHRLEMIRHYAGMDYSYYVDRSAGFFNNIVTTEIGRAVSGFGQFVNVIVILIYIGVYLSAAMLMNWQVALTAAFVSLGLFYAFKGIARRSRELSMQISRMNADIQSLLIQIIHYFKYLKSTGRFEPLEKQLAEKVEGHRRVDFRNSVLVCVPQFIVEPLGVLLVSAMILYYVAYQGRAIGEVLVMLLFFYRAFAKVFGFQVEWQSFCSLLGGVDTVEQVISDLADKKESAGTVVLSRKISSVEIKNISFVYGDKSILQDVSIVVPENKSVAIVGSSGSGKTTLLDHITGLLDPSCGVLLANGQDYRLLDKGTLRAGIGYVVQEPVIFNDTVANNISFWDESLSLKEREDRLKESAGLAHCLEFIDTMAQGWDTVIGDRGVKLSVGQRQRIAIARELYKAPSLMLFDEATSALDSRSEALIQESIETLIGKRTMIIVAHRLSTIKRCDYIYVLDQGRVVEQGSFAALRGSPSSRFAKMCAAQNF